MELVESIERNCYWMTRAKALPLSGRMQRWHRVTGRSDGDDREQVVEKTGDYVDK